MCYSNTNCFKNKENGGKKKMRLFKCEICGNFVELLKDGGGTLVCCGRYD